MNLCQALEVPEHRIYRLYDLWFNPLGIKISCHICKKDFVPIEGRNYECSFGHISCYECNHTDVCMICYGFLLVNDER